MIDVTPREKAIALLVGGVAITAGMWLGLMLMPDATLSVPMEQTHGDAHPAYTPAPPILPPLTLIIPALSAYGALSILRADRSDDTDEAVATDGGQHE